MKYQITLKRPIKSNKNIPFDSIESNFGAWLFIKTEINPKSFIGDLAMIWIGI